VGPHPIETSAKYATPTPIAVYFMPHRPLGLFTGDLGQRAAADGTRRLCKRSQAQLEKRRNPLHVVVCGYEERRASSTSKEVFVAGYNETFCLCQLCVFQLGAVDGGDSEQYA